MEKLNFEQLLKLGGQTQETDDLILDYCQRTPAGNHTKDEWNELYALTSSGSDAEAATENKMAVVNQTDGAVDETYVAEAETLVEEAAPAEEEKD